ncbi:MAG TPA: dihydroorotate dehydrogenase electron transfer subunit [Patescibacteria group bacterium]|nr:dihydroorotate dehydrogenase electron transfer subunit [Patescibacteria group bacterium]
MSAWQGNAQILSNRRIRGAYFHLSVMAARISAVAKPGQFVMVKVNRDGQEPLLRRPLGIHNAGVGRLSLLYEVIGKGTQILSQRRPGELLDIIGPLGNGFDTGPRMRGARPVLVAGGMGVAPLVFLARKLKAHTPLVLIGAKTGKGILCAEEFNACGCRVRLSSDDGTRGFKGKVTGLFKSMLRQGKTGMTVVYACGPRPMLRELSVLCRQQGIPLQVSLEAHMACGIGACLGCAVETHAGYRRVCKDGPVFPAAEIVW